MAHASGTCTVSNSAQLVFSTSGMALSACGTGADAGAGSPEQ